MSDVVHNPRLFQMNYNPRLFQMNCRLNQNTCIFEVLCFHCEHLKFANKHIGIIATITFLLKRTTKACATLHVKPSHIT